MNAPKCDEFDYINFLVATPRVYSCTEAARVQPDQQDSPAHDAFNRLLLRRDPDPQALWQEAQHEVDRSRGLLVVDDSTLDKFYAKKIELVHRHWSGKHRRVVWGINLITLFWTDGDRFLPCDYRLFDKPTDGFTKNEHFRQMLQTAKERGFAPRLVVFDSWYGALDNLKLIRGFEWEWLTQLKENRLVNLDRQGNREVRHIEIGAAGAVVHLRGYGMIRVFKIVSTDGDVEYWATSKLGMSELERLAGAEQACLIETYHRGLKQYCGVERCQARRARAQRNHIGLALRAFLRLEVYGFHQGVSWFEAKTAIIREAVRAYLVKPLYVLRPTA